MLTENFSNISILYEDNNTCIYSAVRIYDTKKVILKTHKRSEDYGKIKHEYGLLSQKKMNGISNVLELVQDRNRRLYLVSEDVGAVVLENYIAGNKFSEKAFQQVLSNACESLEQIHKENIIHGDIKPANMLIDPNNLKVWFIDFGISLSTNVRAEQRQGKVTGSLEYMSPEQTGRINQLSDIRSDIYSLGITMYRVFTGVLPFTGKTAAELIHEHVTVIPASPKNLVTASDFISDVIMKMIEKLPEDRYQAASSIAYDINRYRTLKSLKDSREISKFRIGEKDIFANLESNGKNYCKVNDFKLLQDTFDNISESKLEVVLLEGTEASGKTFLLNKFERYINTKYCFVFRGASDYNDGGNSFHMIRDAFSNFESQLVSMNLSFNPFKKQFMEQMGDNIRTLLEMLPNFKDVFDLSLVCKLDLSQTHLSEAVENKLKMENTFSTLVQVISNIPCPSVYIFDNLQWTDAVCLRLLFAAINNSDLKNCMFVISFRSDDGTNAKMLEKYVQTINPNHTRLTNISLSYPAVADVSGIVTDLFPMERQDANELARHIISSSKGQIQDVAETLRLLFRTKALSFDDNSKLWRWNRDIGCTEDICERSQIVQLYDSLDEKTKSVLHLITCIGIYMSKQTMEIVFGGKAECDQALELGSQFMNAGWFGWNRRIKQYSFSSGRMQKTLYERIPEEAKCKCHYIIGKQLYEYYAADTELLISHCTAITDQFNIAGISHIEDKEDLFNVILLNKISGDSAARVSNFEKAKKYYETALRINADSVVAGHQRLIDQSEVKEIKKNLASCRYALGEHEAAIGLYRNLIKYSHDQGYRFNIYNTMVRHLMSSSKWGDALSFIKEYLGDADLVDNKSENPSSLGEFEFLKFKCSKISRDTTLLRSMNMSGDPVAMRNGSMLALLAANSMMNFDPFTRYYTYLTINYAAENGGFPDLEKALALVVGMFAAEGEFEYANSIFESSIAFAERNNLPKSMLLAVYSASLAHFRHPFSEIMSVYQKARQTAKLEGDYYYSSFMDIIILGYSIFSGVRFAKISRDVDAAAYNAEKNGLVDFKNIFKILYKQFIKCMNGSTHGLDTFDDNNFCEAEFIETTGETSWNFISLFYYPHRMQALFTHGFYTEMLEYSSGIKLNYVDNEQRALYYNRMKYLFYQSMAIIKLCENDHDFLGEHLSKLYGNNDRLKEYAEANQDNFGPVYRLVELEISKLSGLRLSYIGEYYKLSMEFKKLGHYYERAIIDESLAHLWTLKYKVEHYREIQTQKALELYRAIGAKAKVKMLSEGADPVEKANIDAETRYSLTSIANSATLASSSVDYNAILELISILASDSSLDEMAEDLLSVLIKNAVSDQAFLFLNNRDELELYNYRYVGDRIGALSSMDLPATLSNIEKTAVPHKLINYVKEKKTAAIANSGENEYGFLGDPYLVKTSPQSFLCMPILTNSSLIGVIYLENSRLPGIFPADRVNFLNYITTQSGLLIKNALNARSMADHNTELERRLNSHTKQWNTLIGGIAHEINTPLGVCVTVVTDLMKQAGETITAFENQGLSKAGLEEYFEETSKGFEILLGNITRAVNLIQNFKQITVNQTASTPGNIDIIKEFNNILDYVRPAIKNIVGSSCIHGPDKLRMNTSSGALAQVFTNIIMNSAIHAFEGMQKADCRIDIEINEGLDSVSIVYKDNGRGMTAEEKEQFFDPFFTMRRADGGSGLGGHIILSTVTQTLGGTIQLVSSPGHGCMFNIRLPKNIDKVVSEYDTTEVVADNTVNGSVSDRSLEDREKRGWSKWDINTQAGQGDQKEIYKYS